MSRRHPPVPMLNMFDIFQNVLGFLAASFLFSSHRPPPPVPSLTFQLRHEHALTDNSRNVFSDIPSAQVDAHARMDKVFRVKTQDMGLHRPTGPSIWSEVEVPGPNISDRESLRQLAMMTSNAYEENATSKDWYDLGPDWNSTYPFGWEPDADGFRGQIFVSTDNSTVVVSIKGTSAGWLVGGGGSTVKKDKINDNILFSCCCAKVGPTWSPVCGCHAGGYKCDQNCLEKSVVEDSLFYPIGLTLYNNVSYLYPDANIWLVGHSLGGSLASLVGITFGAPVVTFQAPGERLAASRLHLIMPPSTQHITHFLHTADPIAMGTCNGVSSVCAIGGYAMESRCHLGKVGKYDTVSKLGWSVNAKTHAIQTVIDVVLKEDWDPEHGISVPVPEEEVDCVDCFDWEYGDFKKSNALGL